MNSLFNNFNNQGIVSQVRNDRMSSIAFISDNGIKATYGEVFQFSERIRKHISDKPLIFSLCENTPGSLLGYFAFISNEAVPLMLDAKIDAELLNNLLSIFKPNYVWMPDSMSPVFESKKVIFSEFGYSLHSFSAEKIQLNEELALLLTTSGSTGSPKLVRLSYKNIKANAESIAQYLAITSDEKPITSLPMHYSYGLSVINSHLIKGATILLSNHSVMQKEFWAFAQEQKATSIAGVPYTYEILKRLRVFRMELPHLTTMTQAGGKLNASLAKEYIEQAYISGKRFIVMYGQTEATARMSYLPFEKALEKYSSIGIAIPGGSFKLINEGIEIEEPDTDGELVYFGNNVSLGYAECQADLSKDDENHGVLYTGDIARRDKDGFYYITGRKKRFIKLFGNRINLDATEQLLRNNLSGGEFVCAGEDDKMVIFTTAQNISNDIISFIVDKMGINKQGFLVKEISFIPKNSSGKILYTEFK